MVKTVDPTEFSNLLHLRSQILVSNGAQLVARGAREFTLTRPLLSLLQSESSQLEELLDAYGARSNQTWHLFRMHVAVLKNFSSAGYELLHLSHTFHSYDFRGTHPDFDGATQGALTFVSAMLFCSLKQLVEDTYAFGWLPPEEMLSYDFSEELPEGMLPKNRVFPGKVTAQQLVTRLATSFLNNTEDARFLETASKCTGPDWRGLNFDLVSEANIRVLEEKFHTLQSLYDTYVSQSEIEGNDTSLRSLRGHISLVLHLLKVLTVFLHFYERHIHLQGDEIFCHKNCVLKSDWYLEIVTRYLCKYSYEFLTSARDLCQHMLQRYAVIDTIEVAAPPYFGFHVRPATLIASIVRHYGSRVTMQLDREYDAGVPMNLFLANEWLNQLKRQHVGRALASYSNEIKHIQSQMDSNVLTPVEGIHELLRSMADKGLIQILSYPLAVANIIKTSASKTLTELLQAVIAHLLAQRQINIIYPVKVKFSGDVRVLDDIRILAENGYGENERGANIPLPPELLYLSHARPAK